MYKNKNERKKRPLLPDCLYQFSLDNKLVVNENVVVFADNGKKYVLGDIFNKKYHQNVDYTNMVSEYEIPGEYRPFCKCRKSHSLICCSKKGNIAIISPGNWHSKNPCKVISLRIDATELCNLLLGKSQTNFLPLNKQMHVFAVAEYMYRNASKYELNSDEMYTLGLLHDVGYLYGSFGHGINGANLLEADGYIFSSEIRYHGKYQQEYSSPALSLLNEADMQINSYGEFVGYDARLKEIGERYGFDSKNYEYSSKLINQLRNGGITNEIS